MTILHLSIALLVGLIASYFLSNESNAFIVLLTSLIAVAALEIFLTPIVIMQISRPIRLITQALLHVSSEISETPPPNVNNWYDHQSGLKHLVQTIYELASSSTQYTQEQGSSQTAFATSLLQKLPVGVVVLDRHQRAVFTNEEGKTLFEPNLPDNHRSLDSLRLRFPQTDNLSKWLEHCRKNKIQELRTWQHIADRPFGKEERKIFDIVAYYNKKESHDIELTLVAIDRTKEYETSDESMDFIALAAHELRGPITIIRGYLEMFNDELGDKFNTGQEILMERLEVSASQLSGYINNILNVARYDRDHMQLHLQEEDWRKLMEIYLVDLEQRAHAHNRILTIHIPENLPTVAVDSTSIQEVITNLVDNAIKYSHENGEIIINVKQDGDFIETTVTDTGIGMPASVTERLFTKFYRSHRSRQVVSGTGLGLYLCKAIVESHGGNIWVRSTEHQGSTFGFRLPTYASVADKLKKGDNSNKNMIMKGSHGWIKNHSYYRR